MKRGAAEKKRVWEDVQKGRDYVLGKLVSISPESVVIRTADAGLLSIARRVARSVVAGARLPGEIETDFSMGTMDPWKAKGGGFSVTDGALVCDLRATREKLRLFRTSQAAEGTGQRGALVGDGEVLPVGHEEPLLEELRSFVQACRVRRLQSPAADGWAGAAAVSVVEACSRSAAEGRRIEVKLPTPARESAA